MRVILLIGFLLGSHFTSAQIKFDVNVSDKHLQKVKRLKGGEAKLKHYRKFYKKDSIKAARSYWRSYLKENKDSLKRIGEWKTVKTNKEQFLKGHWNLPVALQDSIDISSFPVPKDSLDWAMQELAKQRHFGTLQEVYREYQQYDSAYLDKFHPDSIKINPEQLAERFKIKERLSSYMPKEMVERNDLDFKKKMEFGSINKFGDFEKVDRSGFTQLLNKVTPEQLTTSMSTLKLAKEKPDELLSGLGKKKEIKAVEKKSLQGTPFKNRLFLNGNVNIPSTDPFVLDINIQTGYRWTDKLSSGLGFTYREQLGSESSSSLSGDSFGASFFTSYDVRQNFFAYTESQLMVERSLFKEPKSISKNQIAYMVGVGKDIRISKKASVRTLLLYDLNHKRNTINWRPVVLRVGYELRF